MSDSIFSSTILFGALGNPGTKYSSTRHNIGFLFADKVTTDCNFSHFTFCQKLRGFISSGKMSNKDILFIKPDTYMNLSGKSILAAVNAFKVNPENIFIIHDDVDISFGKQRIKVGGGDGGHNGLKSIAAELQTNMFNRIRLGVGKSSLLALDKYVLSDFLDDERKYIDNVWAINWNSIFKTVIENGVSEAMNSFNRK